MRTETKMMTLILQIAENLQAEAVALSGSRINPQTQEDEFQDYDVVYIVENLNDLLSDLSWLDQFGMRLIEQHNVLGHRRLYLMLFEDGNRIDLTLCPKSHIQEWVDSEAGFTVLVDEKGLFEPYFSKFRAFTGRIQLERLILKNLVMNFGGCQPTWSKESVVSKSSMPLTISMVFVSKNS